MQARFMVRYDGMPLAVYRELAAHLRCVTGVETKLEWNPATVFRYTDSQIGAMQVRLAPQADQEQVKRILDYYGTWQEGQDLESEPTLDGPEVSG